MTTADDADTQIGHLELEEVTRAFGDTVALDRFSLQIQGGEFVALLGPSGSGKSTALNCLAGLLPLSHGRIMLDGQRIDGLAPERRGFGMVFQNYAVFPHMTVADNVGFGLTMRRMPKEQRQARVDECLAMVRLDPHAEKYPNQLSGGERQRVAIARAIAFQPPVVLMDEPLSNLDAKLRIELRTEIRKLHQRLGLTTVYVTHDQSEALSLADRIVVLNHSRIEQIGTPNEVYARPANAFVAGFMGYRSLLDAEVLSTRDGDADSANVVVRMGGVELSGTAIGRLSGSKASVALRPEDVTTVPDAGPGIIDAVVDVAEYTGREYALEATSTAGLTLFFYSDTSHAPGHKVHLAVAPERLLVFDAVHGDAATVAAEVARV
ncbi:MAG: ABC transporter ATP-binding protein [Geodermatophilaceae bacterium]|nr:ABC transporter ATP-binding protein [Geodermatophilaceae bacterium]MDQ3476027.1 ABC transporter ATP-binding protein [Actinomycetota bacterium]